jgi:hypothetical protein
MKKLIATAILLVSLVGCGATLGTIIATVISVITDAALIVDQVQDFVDTYFDGKPDPVVQAKITAIIGKCKTALIMMDRAAKGGQDLNSKDVVAAMKDFQEAFAELMILVEPLGVKIKGEPDKFGDVPARLTIMRPLVMSNAR